MGAAGPDTNEGFHVCLTSHRRVCLDVKNGHYALHQPVLVHGVSGAHALGWNYIKNYIGQGVCADESRCSGTSWPFTSHALDRLCYKDAVDLFPPNINTTLALGEIRGAVQLLNNSVHLGTNLAALWVRSGNLSSTSGGPTPLGKAAVLIASGTANRSSVVAQPESKTSVLTGWYVTGFVK